MHHYGNSILLRHTIDRFQLFHTVQIIVGIEQLVGRMHFDHAYAEANKMFHVSLDIAGVTRINAAARNQPLRVFLYIVGNELIDLRSESHQLGRYVVDEDRAIYSDLIEMMKKFLRRMAEFDDLVKVRPLLLHHRQSRGLEHLYGLDVNVAVGDHGLSGYAQT